MHFSCMEDHTLVKKRTPTVPASHHCCTFGTCFYIYIYKTVRLFMVSMFFLGSSLKPSFTLVMFTTQSHLLFFCCSIFKGTLTGILARDGFSFTFRAHAFSGSLDICAGTIAARRFSNICIKAFFYFSHLCRVEREKPPGRSCTLIILLTNVKKKKKMKGLRDMQFLVSYFAFWV